MLAPIALFACSAPAPAGTPEQPPRVGIRGSELRQLDSRISGERHYRSRPGERTLYGHSFGGLFEDYVLLEHPDLFDRIISISPSIWYADRYLIRKQQEVHDSGRRLSVWPSATGCATCFPLGHSERNGS